MPILDPNPKFIALASFLTFGDTLTFHNHVDVVVEKTARSFSAIKTECTVSMEMHYGM